MNEDFKELMSSKSSDELLTIAHKKNEFQLNAFEAAVDELHNRGLSEQIAELLNNYKEKERQDELENERVLRLPELYSLNAIVTLSCFFTAICGAFLMSYNFKKLGNFKKSKEVLVFGFVYALSFIALISLIDNLIIKFVLQIGALIGGYIITVYFEKDYPEDLEHRIKPLWKALIVSIIVSLSAIVSFVLIWLSPFK